MRSGRSAKFAYLRSFTARADSLDIGVTGKQKMRGHGFKQGRAVLARIRSPDKIEQRMGIALVGAFIKNEGQRTNAFGDQPHRAVDDGVSRIALARKRGVIARRPARPSSVIERDQARSAGRFGFGWAEKRFETTEHGFSVKLAHKRQG
jgi:hypothetical protein